jgi:hypothetical protein
LLGSATTGSRSAGDTSRSIDAGLSIVRGARCSGSPPTLSATIAAPPIESAISAPITLRVAKAEPVAATAFVAAIVAANAATRLRASPLSSGAGGAFAKSSRISGEAPSSSRQRIGSCGGLRSIAHRT